MSLLRKTVFGMLGKVFPDAFIYDTSNFYSSEEKMAVQRDSDSVQRTFTGLEITDGTYESWLNGANGHLVTWGADAGGITPQTVGTVNVLPNGKIQITGNAGLNSNALGSWLVDSELPDRYVVAMVMTERENSNNQRTNFAWRGTNTGVTATLIHQTNSNYRKKQLHFGVERQGNQVLHQYFTASSYDNTINNIIVCEITPTEINWIVNGVTTSSGFLTMDNNWSAYDGFNQPNAFSLGNRFGPTHLPAKYKHFSLHLNPPQTAMQIHDEIKRIHGFERYFGSNQTDSTRLDAGFPANTNYQIRKEGVIVSEGLYGGPASTITYSNPLGEDIEFWLDNPPSAISKYGNYNKLYLDEAISSELGGIDLRQLSLLYGIGNIDGTVWTTARNCSSSVNQTYVEEGINLQNIDIQNGGYPAVPVLIENRANLTRVDFNTAPANQQMTIQNNPLLSHLEIKYNSSSNDAPLVTITNCPNLSYIYLQTAFHVNQKNNMDSLAIELDSDGVTNGEFQYSGKCYYFTSSSDTARANLQAKGWVINDFNPA